MKPLATRTQKVYRDKGLFERLASGPVLFSNADGTSGKATLSLIILGLLTALTTLIAFILVGQTGSLSIAKPVAVAALALATLLVLRSGARLGAFVRRRLAPPCAVTIDKLGVHQTSADGTTTGLAWEDIRLVQHRRTAHRVRGLNKDHIIEISKRLEGHATVAAFIKFAFMLRQDIGPDWSDLLTEVRARLEGPGFHFHVDAHRTETIRISLSGIDHSAGQDGDTAMTWEDMATSTLEPTRNMLKFHNKQTRDTFCLPRGTDSDQIVEDLIRWGLHSKSRFSTPAE